jgi:methylated-DNA-[protein]-cysteine S-methyltransferase
VNRARTRVTTSALTTELPSVTVAPSSLGWLGVRWEQTRLCEVRFGFSKRAEAVSSCGDARLVPCESAPPWVADVVARLVRFSQGDFHAVDDISLDLSVCTPFQRKVIEACRALEPGTTCSYGELAEQVGVPRGARAVGNVMRRNRFPLIVPCHRVIAATGALCGFSAPQGLAMKERLLELERQSRARG